MAYKILTSFQAVFMKILTNLYSYVMNALPTRENKNSIVMDEKFSGTFPCHALLFDFTCLHDAWTSWPKNETRSSSTTMQCILQMPIRIEVAEYQRS